MGITLLYGTGNPAKLSAMRHSLDGMNIEILGLTDMPSAPPEVDEIGESPLENARIKALTYFRHYKVPVFSCDSGLYFEGLPDELQPGTNVRTINGRRFTDAEMTEYYSALAGEYGRLTARYLNAVSLVLSEEEIHEYMGAEISGNSFYIVDKPHPKTVEGFPLDRISVHIPTGKYYYDLPPGDFTSEESYTNGWRDFFTKALQSKEKAL